MYHECNNNDVSSHAFHYTFPRFTECLHCLLQWNKEAMIDIHVTSSHMTRKSSVAEQSKRWLPAALKWQQLIIIQQVELPYIFQDPRGNGYWYLETCCTVCNVKKKVSYHF